MIDKILSRLYYLLFFLTPLVMYPATSEIFEFNKILFIYASTILIGLFWIIKMILDKKIILKKTPLDIPIILFLASQVLSTIFSIDVHTSIFGYYGRFNGGLVSTLSYIILYYGFVSNEINVKKSLLWSLFSSVLVIVWGLPGHFNRDLTCPAFNTVLTAMSGKLNGQTLNAIWTKGFNNSCWSRETNVFDPATRMFSTLGQPNWLGAYLAITFFIGVYFLVKNRNDIKQAILYVLYLALNFSAILFSRSRSALASIVIGMAIFAVYVFVVKKIKDVRIIGFALFFVFLMPIMLFKTGIGPIDNIIDFTPRKTTVVKETPVQKNPVPSGATESFDIRKIVWKGAIDLGLKYPLAGTGVETFAYSYFFTRPAAHNLTTEWDFIYNKAHNEYLNYFATTGFTGLVAYIALAVSFVVLSVKHLKIKHKDHDENDNWLTVSLLAAWTTIHATNFFGFSTTTTSLFTYLLPAMTVATLATAEKHKKAMPVNKGNQVVQGLSIFLLFSIAAYALYSLGAYFVADINYGQGVYYSKPSINDYQKAAYYFQEAIKKREEPVYEDRLSYALAYLAGIAAYQKNTEVAQKLISASEYYSVKSLKSSAKNVLYWKTRAKDKYLFYVVNQDPRQLTEGINSLQNARVLAPTDPKIPYSLSVFYSLAYDAVKDTNQKKQLAESAIQEINSSISLKPNYYDGYFFKGQFLKKIGDDAEAKEVFEYILRNVSPNDLPTRQQLQSF